MLFIAFLIWMFGLLSDLSSLFGYIIQMLCSPIELCLLLVILGLLWLPQRIRNSAKSN